MSRLLPAIFLLSFSAVPLHAEEDDLAWVVVRGDHGASMHGEMSDLKRARKYFKDFGPEYLWFRRNGKEYVVRDGKILEEIEEAGRPQEELGNEQARLGQRQSELGMEQSKLGRQQAELGEKQARRAMEQARRELDGEKVAAEDDQADLEKLQQYLSRMQEKLGREQEKIGHEQAKMGRQQEKLAREVEHRIEAVIEASLKNGAARPMN
jgi:chromosome segregation ATPase